MVTVLEEENEGGVPTRVQHCWLQCCAAGTCGCRRPRVGKLRPSLGPVAGHTRGAPGLVAVRCIFRVIRNDTKKGKEEPTDHQPKKILAVCLDLKAPILRRRPLSSSKNSLTIVNNIFSLFDPFFFLS